ncbi:MAG TPA: hypothetical protein VNE58_15855 [Casimicrobiaceae bacterium]|nr:hypothetical protein [Casimicrobiaceae bacterium]
MLDVNGGISPAKAKGIFKLGTPATEIHPKPGMQDGDWLITKHRVRGLLRSALGGRASQLGREPGTVLPRHDVR